MFVADERGGNHAMVNSLHRGCQDGAGGEDSTSYWNKTAKDQAIASAARCPQRARYAEKGDLQES